MRPVPIPDSDTWDGTRRVVLAAPSGDLTDTDVAPLEVLIEDRVPSGRRIFSKWVLEEGELAKLINDGAIWLCVSSAVHPPVALAVVETVGDDG